MNRGEGDTSIYQPGNLRPKFLQRLQSQQGLDQGVGLPPEVQDLGWAAPASVVEDPPVLQEPRFVQRRRMIEEQEGDD